MRFTLIDEITEIVPGERITATKTLSADDEYLQDHFPNFPVMPGVLMLEAMFQASDWLVRVSEDFAHSVVRLKEARNVKFQDFVEPGEVLIVTAQILKQDERTTTLKTQGTVDGQDAVSARLILERFNLTERDPDRAATDRYARRQFREAYPSFRPAAAT